MRQKLSDKVRAIKASLAGKSSKRPQGRAAPSPPPAGDEKTWGGPAFSHERKRLRGPAGLQYAIADSIAMLDAAAWQHIAQPAGFFMSFDYLLALESILPANLTPHYALIYSARNGQKQPVAAVYMQFATMGLAQVRPEKPAGKASGTAWGASLDKLADLATQRVLCCGNLLSFGQHGIAFAPDVDSMLAWHGVVEVLYRVRQAHKIAGRTDFVMIKDLHAPYTEQAAHLANLSYRHVETEPNMVLDLDPSWKGYDDYLASLASKYRANVRNGILKPIDAAGCTVSRLQDLAPVQAEIFALYRAVHSNADIRPFLLHPGYFVGLQQVAGERFCCSVLRQGEALLGFLITVADGDTAMAYHIGFDRAAAAHLPIYLRLLHASVADAIALGCKRISYGRTALEPKASLGAKPQPFSVLLRHRQPVLNKLLKHLLLGIEHDEAPERNPFKKAGKGD
jgi:predicted N-acyltransferase